MKISVVKNSENTQKMLHRNGIKEKSKAKDGAKGVGRILKTKVAEDDSNYLPSKDEILEIPIRKLGKGEMFGQDDLFHDRSEYTATLKCISLQAEIYRISKEVLYIYIYIYYSRILSDGSGIYQK